MYRTSKMSGKWYVVEIEELDSDEVENIIDLVTQGTPVLITDTIDDISKIVDDEIELVE